MPQLSVLIEFVCEAHAERETARALDAERAGHPVRDGRRGAFDKKEVAQLQDAEM